MTLEQRFWSKVNKTDTCWLWVGYKNFGGYGIFSVSYDNAIKRPCGRKGRIIFAAHRFSYELHYSDIPKGRNDRVP